MTGVKTPKRLKMTPEERKILRGKLSAREAAKLLGCSHQTVCNLRRKLGVVR